MARARPAGAAGDVMFTGHSLGGGLAELAGLRASLEGLVPKAQVEVDSVAAPRVFDEATADLFNAQLPRTYRLVNFSDGALMDTQDVVTLVPPKALGYRHVGNLVRLRDDGFELITHEDDPAGLLRMARSGAEAAFAPKHAAPDEDAADAQVEKLKGAELETYLRNLALQNRERHGVPAQRPVADAVRMEAIAVMPKP